MAGELWPQVGQLGGVVVLVAFVARWVWGIERDMIRRYAARAAELEKRCVDLEAESERRRAELEAELDNCRREYWALYRAQYSQPPRRQGKAGDGPDD